jgi:hypothetical protein
VSAPYGLTVGQLRLLLASMPKTFDDHVVVLAQDAEGNGFDTLSEAAVGWLNDRHEMEFRGCSPVDDDTWEQAEDRATQDYTTDEDDKSYVPLDEHDHPAVCLWP